jgi:CRISPR-associated endoribonuclease Cas2 subtype I-E
MIVIITSNVEGRITGMLRSVLHEVAPSVFVSVDMGSRSFDRVWQVLENWFRGDKNQWVVGLTSDKTSVERLKVRTLGQPKREWAEIDGFHLLKIRDLASEA